MKILSISAQKPDSTGSGTYLTELVRGFCRLGHEQAVIAGVYRDDAVVLPDNVDFRPVYFKSDELPFAIAGMSDAMPYDATRYRDMDETMTAQFKAAFSEAITRAVAEFKPDLIVCHHLYIVTALTRSLVSDVPVVAVCHGTCLRQFHQHGLERDFIAHYVKKLDAVFALHEAQKDEIASLMGVDEQRIHVLGCGYNPDLFNTQGRNPREDGPTTIAYAGKITLKKGLYSLIDAMDRMKTSAHEARFVLAGGFNDKDEFDDIAARAQSSCFPVELTGAIPQSALADLFRKADVFVLPSFFEGLPLVVVEAMACGCRILTTDLPGVKPWLQQNIPDAPVTYVPLPRLHNVDEAVEADLPTFAQNLACALDCAVEQGRLPDATRTNQLSWGGTCTRLLNVADPFIIRS